MQSVVTITITGLDPMLTIRQAAKLVGVCDHTMKAIIAGNGIPTVQVGKRNKIRVSDFQAWIQSTKGP